MTCRLCQSQEGLQPVSGADERRYFLCDCCGMIGVSPVHFLGGQDERERYLTHKNGIEYQGYVTFLRRAIDPALAFLSAGMTGLDYGCGPAPTLSALLRREGIGCEDYDPFFAGHPMQKIFDFVFSTEAFEHFFHPGREIRKIRALLRPKGLLIVMTQRWKDPAHFSQWHYARDPTHVSFYHARTFDFLCRAFGFRRIFDDGDRVVILRKEDKQWMNSPTSKFKS
jgi:SAM-dependent methyltransferase